MSNLPERVARDLELREWGGVEMADVEAYTARSSATVLTWLAERRVIDLNLEVEAMQADERMQRELNDQIDALHYKLDLVADMIERQAHQPRRRGRC